MLEEIPPRLGSRRPADLWRQGLLLRHLRKLDTRGAVDVTRLLTGSIADLIDRYFDSDAMRGLLSVSGVIGTWAGPRSAGTAYVMLHHHIGDTGGQAGAWGFPRGGMGGVTAALAASARSFGAEVRTGAEVAQITTSGGRVTGVTAGQRRGDRRADRDHYGPPRHLVPAARRRARPARRLRRGHPRLADPVRHGEDQPRAGPAAGLRQPSRVRPAGARRDDRAGREPGRRRERLPGRGRRAAVGGPVRGHLHPQRLRRLAGPGREARHVDVHPVGAAHLRRRSPTRPRWPPTPTG